jgi:hypothetical protein
LCVSIGQQLLSREVRQQYRQLWDYQPRWLVAPGLLYAQVRKSYRRRKLARVERCMRLDSLDHWAARLKSLGLTGSINTSFVERINLTLRHALAALSRRSWATAQLSSELVAHLE